MRGKTYVEMCIRYPIFMEKVDYQLALAHSSIMYMSIMCYNVIIMYIAINITSVADNFRINSRYK